MPFVVQVRAPRPIRADDDFRISAIGLIPATVALNEHHAVGGALDAGHRNAIGILPTVHDIGIARRCWASISGWSGMAERVVVKDAEWAIVRVEVKRCPGTWRR